MVYKNLEAYKQITKVLVRVLDTFVSQVNFEFTKGELRIIFDLTNKTDNKQPQNIKITCQNILELDYSIFPDDPVYIEDFKLFYDVEQESYYFSVDPDNSVPNISETDCKKLHFKNLILGTNSIP